VQTERNTKSKTKFLIFILIKCSRSQGFELAQLCLAQSHFSEVPPNLSTISANREQNKIKTEVFVFFMPPDFLFLQAKQGQMCSEIKKPRR